MKYLAALWSLPAIEGLTEPLAGLGEEDRNEVFTEPADPKLLTMNLDAGGEVTSLDAHPLLREFLANALRESRPEAWKAGHKRLYQHLTTMTPEKPAPTLDDLQPLYQAVAHGCLAGLEQDGCGKVYIGRILRGTGSDGFYSSKKLGAFGADLGAVACFFDPPWIRVSPDLTPPYQAWLLNDAGSRLLALGRLTEVLEPMRAGLAGAVVQEDWKNAAVRASNLSELELTLGDVGAAIRDAETAVAHADRGGDEFRRMAHRTTHAEALHQGGMGRRRGISRPSRCRSSGSPNTHCSLRSAVFGIPTFCSATPSESPGGGSRATARQEHHKRSKRHSVPSQNVQIRRSR
jgi:hypothetical protein